MSYHHSHQLPVVGAGGGIEPTFFNPRVPPPIPQLMQQEIGTQYSTTSASIAHSTLDQPRQSISHSEQQPWHTGNGMYSDAVATQHDSKLPFNARPDGSRDSGRIRVRTPERARGNARRSRSRSREKRHRRYSSSGSSNTSRDRSHSSRSRSHSGDRDYRNRDQEDQDYRRSHGRRDRDSGRSNRDRERGSDGRRRDYSPRHYTSKRREPEVVPCSKVMLPSLPAHADRDTVNIMIARQGFHPIDIRIVRRTPDTGVTRVFGFVEFSDVSQATAWIEFNQGCLRFDDGYQVRMEYSRERDSADSDRRATGPNIGGPSSDWTCSKCTINNFNRRSNCFKCGISRTESEELDAKGYAMVGVSPSDTLLIRELPTSATEESVRHCLSQYTQLVIQRISVSTSRRYALIQMRSIADSTLLLQTFNRVVPYVDNCAVIITYSRQSLNQILIMENVNILKSKAGISSAHIHEDPTNSAAKLAQNAIRIAQMSRQPGASMQLDTPIPQSISTPFGYLPSYPTPNSKEFQIEPSSGYYYDKQTGFYFDQKTGYYYNSTTNAWMFWSSRYSTYINCEDGDQELKKRLQEEEIKDQARSSSAVISAPPTAGGSSNIEEISSELAEDLCRVQRELDRQNDLLTRSITERSKGADVPADILESIIVKIKKLEQEKEEIRHKIDFNRKIQERKRGHRSPEVIEYELNGNPSKQRNLSQINLHTSDDDDIEFIEELHIKRPHNRHSKKQRKHRSRSTSNSRMGSSNRRSRDYPLNSQPSNKYSVGKSNQSSAALVFARALSDTVKDRSDVQLVPREFSEHQPIPQHKLPLLPTPIQQQPKNLFMDNSHHWKIADQQQASHSYNLQHALSSSTPSVIQSPSLSLSMPVSLPFLNPPSTPEDLQLRMVQELAILDKEKEKLEHQKQNLFPTKSARQAPLIRAENPDRARVDEELAASKHVSSLDAAKVKQRALLERALNATRQRVEERARQLDGQKRLIQMQKDQELWKDLNICFNCAQPGHNMLHCSNQPASDVVLENAVKKAKETIFKSQQIKQQYKTRAEHYRVTRKDPFMLRLRIRVPDGLIHRDHLAQLCSRCANFGHSAFGPKACRAAKASPHLLRTISNKLVEFTKIFFFHLNDENLVDFSKKFQLYNTMDAIERGCYADPIGLNLQSLCPSGQVTMQELKLCSKCAELGHKQQDCIKTEEVNKEFYENMLKLVTAYRTLVKEQGTLQMPVYSSNALAPINKPAEPSKNAPQKTNAELKRSRTTKEPIEMITLDSDSDNEATSHNQPKNVHTEVTPSEVDNADVIPNGEQIDVEKPKEDAQIIENFVTSESTVATECADSVTPACVDVQPNLCIIEDDF